MATNCLIIWKEHNTFALLFGRNRNNLLDCLEGSRNNSLIIWIRNRNILLDCLEGKGKNFADNLDGTETTCLNIWKGT